MSRGLETHHRRSLRLPGYDYSQAGAYFVTICIQNRECLLGEIADGEMRANRYGSIVDTCWRAIPDHFADVSLDAFVIMPNHIHGITVIGVGTTHASPLQRTTSGPRPRSLASMAGSFKSAAAKHINILRNTPGTVLWQRNYYEHVVRSEAELSRIREYIATNPARWELDKENPNNRP